MAVDLIFAANWRELCMHRTNRNRAGCRATPSPRVVDYLAGHRSRLAYANMNLQTTLTGRS